MVIAVAVVKRGVTPLETEIFGVTVPYMYIMPVEAATVLLPIEKCVMVLVPPEHCGNVMLVVGLTEAVADEEPAMVQPTVVRATPTRA